MLNPYLQNHNNPIFSQESLIVTIIFQFNPFSFLLLCSSCLLCLLSICLLYLLLYFQLCCSITVLARLDPVITFQIVLLYPSFSWLCLLYLTTTFNILCTHCQVSLPESILLHLAFPFNSQPQPHNIVLHKLMVLFHAFRPFLCNPSRPPNPWFSS